MKTRALLVVAVLALASRAEAAPPRIESPAAGTAAGPEVRFAAVAPPGTARLVFFVDDTRIASFDGPGRHVFSRRLEQPGPRRFRARALDADGGLVGEASAAFTARGLVLRPRDGAFVGGANARIEAVPYGLGPIAHVVFSADDIVIGHAYRAPYVIHRTFSQDGRRQIVAKAFAASGQLLGEAREPLVVRLPLGDLVPPRSRGAIRRVEGVRLNERTLAMLENAGRWLERNGGCPPSRASARHATQGSYSRGVSASAGTHDGGGAVDLSVSGLSRAQRRALVRALREAGFAAWLRTPPSFRYHIHAIAIGDPDLSAEARRQGRAYFRGRDGLAGDRSDPHGGPIVKTWMR